MSRKKELELMIGKNERIYWQGKPDFKCYMAECLLSKLILFFLAYGGFGFAFYYYFISSGVIKFNKEVTFSAGNIMLVAFMIAMATPLIITIGDILLSLLRYRNTEYVITDRGVYISGGTFAYTHEMKSFMEMSHVDIHRGIFDQILQVGDVYMMCNTPTINASGVQGGSLLYQYNGPNPFKYKFAICDVPDYRDVFYLLKDLQKDIYSDVMYPNDLRPKENHGYKTGYKGNDNDGNES